MMKELIYAPVMIPTLNRIDHFKVCVETLTKCKYADKTELFISVDYPPTEKYMEGYQEICKYLQNEPVGFKQVHIYYQKENLGVTNNINFLLEKIYANFDRYIFSEDDNEFAYNFLEYMDKGLMLFQEDDSVLSICGIQDEGPWKEREETAVYTQVCPEYGIGCWKAKELRLREIPKEYFLNEIGKNPKRMSYLWKRNKMCYQQFVEGMLCGKNHLFWEDNDTISWCDTVKSIYAICEGKYFIAPQISKVRNWGFDGSGANMEKEKFDPCKKWVLDTDESFDYKINFDERIVLEDSKYADKHLYRISWIYLLRARIRYFLNRCLKNTHI